MIACLPETALSPDGRVLSNKNTNLMGIDPDLYVGYHMADFVGMDTWFEWESRFSQRSRVKLENVITCLPNSVWLSNSTATRLKDGSIKIKATKLEKIKGDRLSLEFARATDGWVLSDREKSLAEFLGGLPASILIKFFDSQTCQEVDPLRATAAVACCDLSSIAEAIRKLNGLLSHRAHELFTVLPGLQTIRARAGDHLGQEIPRPRSPALKSVAKSNFNMGTTATKVETRLPQDLINLLTSYRNCTVTVHSDDPKTGYQYLAVQPYLTEERLNRPISELLMMPVDGTVDPRLSAPAIAGIEKAILLGSTSGTYSFEWDRTPGEIWEFEQTFSHLKAFGVVIKCTYDLHNWQIEWWKRQIEKELQTKSR